MPQQTRSRKGGRFLLSDAKITEFEKIGLTPENYTTSKLYHNELVNFVIDNSIITPVSSGSFGITYKLKLKPTVKSPYFKIDSDKMETQACTAENFYMMPCITEVRTFLLKLSFIGKSHDIINTINNTGAMSKIPVKDFQQEAQLQDEIYEKTFDLANSLVPACVSPALIHDTPSPLFDRLKVRGSRLLDLDLRRPSVVGLILMEFAEGYTTLDSILEKEELLTGPGDIIPTKKFSIQAATAFLLYQAAHLLLYKAGYAHGDHHYGNVMINVEKQQVLIIDFGQTRNITKEHRPEFIPASFTQILNYLQKTAEQKEFLELIRHQRLNSFPAVTQLQLILAERTRKSKLILERFRESKDVSTLNFVRSPTFTNYNKLRWHLLTMYNASQPSTPTASSEAEQSPKAITPMQSVGSDPGSTGSTVSSKQITTLFRSSILSAVNNSNITEVANVLTLLTPLQSVDLTAIKGLSAQQPVTNVLKQQSLEDVLTDEITRRQTVEAANLLLAELRSILLEKDVDGKTILHKAAVMSIETDIDEDVISIKRNVKRYMPKTPQLQIIKALIDAEPSLPDIKDNNGTNPGNEFYSGNGATRSYIKRRQADSGTWSALKKMAGIFGGRKTTHRRHKHPASYHGHRASHSSPAF
jgi:serine/threonine protein kinase